MQYQSPDVSAEIDPDDISAISQLGPSLDLASDVSLPMSSDYVASSVYQSRAGILNSPPAEEMFSFSDEILGDPSDIFGRHDARGDLDGRGIAPLSPRQTPDDGSLEGCEELVLLKPIAFTACAAMLGESLVKPSFM
jgi:hypothetical protein